MDIVINGHEFVVLALRSAIEGASDDVLELGWFEWDGRRNCPVGRQHKRKIYKDMRLRNCAALANDVSMLSVAARRAQ